MESQSDIYPSIIRLTLQSWLIRFCRRPGSVIKALLENKIYAYVLRQCQVQFLFTLKISRVKSYCSVLLKWEFSSKMRASYLQPVKLNPDTNDFLQEWLDLFSTWVLSQRMSYGEQLYRSSMTFFSASFNKSLHLNR